MVMKFGVKNEWMNYYEWDIKYPTDVAGKKLEVLSVANHKKILNYIQSHFSFPGIGIYISLSTGLRPIVLLLSSITTVSPARNITVVSHKGTVKGNGKPPGCLHHRQACLHVHPPVGRQRACLLYTSRCV